MKTARKTWEYAAGLLILACSAGVYLYAILSPPLPWSRMVHRIPDGFWAMVVAAFVTIVIAEAAIAGRWDIGAKKSALFRAMAVSLLINAMCAAILMLVVCQRELSGFSSVQSVWPAPLFWIAGLSLAGSAGIVVASLTLLTLRPRVIIWIAVFLLLALVLAGEFVACRKPYLAWSGWAMPQGLRVRLLVKALGDPDREVRLSSVCALGGIGPAAKDAVPALIKALDNKDIIERQVIVLTLGAIGPEAKEAIPSIVAALGSDPDQGMSLNVAETLARICRGSKISILAWGAVCDNKDERIQALIKPLSDPDAEFRATAAEMLGYIGPAARKAISELERLVEKDSNDNVRRFAREALEKIRK